MGRPSVAAERKRQILDAAIRCIASNGVAATTLDRIAEESGMVRGHVRHFAGNRDDILLAAARMFFLGDGSPDGDDGPTGSFFPVETNTVASALDFLFGDLAAPGSDNVVALAFVDAGRSASAIHDLVVEAYSGARTTLAALLAAEFPAATASAHARVAYGVLSLALGNVFLGDVGIPQDDDRMPRADAGLLVASLAVA